MDEQEVLAVLRTLLAYERNYLAIERTQLAQLRTGLTLALIPPPAAATLAYALEFLPKNYYISIIVYIFLAIITVYGIWMSVRSYFLLKKTRVIQARIQKRQREVAEQSRSVKTLLEGILIENGSFGDWGCVRARTILFMIRQAPLQWASLLVAGKIVAAAIFLIVLVAIAGLGIYYYDAYHKLSFQLKNVSLSSVSLTAVQTNFAIAITNPNALPIYIPSGDFEIYINNQHLGKGSFGSVTIGGNSQSQLTVPVTFTTNDALSVLSGLITGGGSVTVTIQGSANLGFFSVPFNATLYNATFR
jgi:LEA14-like dessication related protein